MFSKELKQISAEAALDYIEIGGIIGVGTGSTVDFFIDALGRERSKIEGAVASSERSRRRLSAKGVPVFDLNAVDDLGVYVDGADEADRELRLIKGGGGALTREKIIAGMSRRFVCIADESKLVERLGRFPLPVEVIPMARSMVARKLSVMGGTPRLRKGFVTDNGNQIIDVGNLDMTDPLALEEKIDRVPGVVSVGLFVRRRADVLLLGRKTGGIDVLTPPGKK